MINNALMKMNFFSETRLVPVALSALMLLSSCYRQKIVVDQIPLNTPANSAIYITGNFNNWDPGDERFRMNRDSAGTYSIMLPRGIGELSYKFTRGDWTRVEKNECGYDIQNRSLVYGEEDVVTDQIECWGDTEPMNCTQTVFVIADYPEDTPEDALIYMASEYNFWNPGDLSYAMQKHPKGFYFRNVEKQGDCIEFKFTMGDWASVETDNRHRDIANRRYCFDDKDTVFLSVKSWKTLNYRKLSKVTFVLEKLPPTTRPDETFYIAGDFNNWDPGNPDYSFGRDQKGRPVITITTDKETLEYKITRGNWKSVETMLSGKDVPNRLNINHNNDTILLKIDQWKDRR